MVCNVRQVNAVKAHRVHATGQMFTLEGGPNAQVSKRN